MEILINNGAIKSFKIASKEFLCILWINILRNAYLSILRKM